MNQITQPDVAEKETVDFLTIIIVNYHLMILYALHPCEPLAANINRHIKVVLNSSASDTLGEWKGTFRKILSQWELIAEQHLQSAKIKQQIIAHKNWKKLYQNNLVPLSP